MLGLGDASKAGTSQGTHVAAGGSSVPGAAGGSLDGWDRP